MLFDITEDKIKKWEETGKSNKLSNGLSHKDEKIRKSALEALTRMNWSPSNELESASKKIAEGDFGSCVQFGENAIIPLLEVMEDQNVTEKANDALLQIGSQGVDLILDEINMCLEVGDSIFDRSKNLSQKGNRLCQLLVKMGENIVDKLINRISFSSFGLKLIIISLLGDISSAKATDKLIELLEQKNWLLMLLLSYLTLSTSQKQYETAMIKIHAAQSLGKIGDKTALPTLKKFQEKLSPLSDYALQAGLAIDLRNRFEKALKQAVANLK